MNEKTMRYCLAELQRLRSNDVLNRERIAKLETTIQRVVEFLDMVVDDRCEKCKPGRKYRHCPVCNEHMYLDEDTWICLDTAGYHSTILRSEPNGD